MLVHNKNYGDVIKPGTLSDVEVRQVFQEIKKPISIQHPFAEIEIVAWDSLMTILISKNDDIVRRIKKNNILVGRFWEIIYTCKVG